MSAQMPPLSMPDNGEAFAPDASTSRSYRDALGRFGTGVTVITCDGPFGPLGITANSFASVSLDPPLVLWSPAKSSKRFDAFVTAQRYAIHVVSTEQAAICQGFTTSGDAFDGYDWHLSEHAVPLISHCLARFECRRHAVHEGGDHAIVVGCVERVSTQAGVPLMFYSGKFGGFQAA